MQNKVASSLGEDPGSGHVRAVTESDQMPARRKQVIVPVSRAVRHLGVVTILLYGAIMQPTPDSVTLQLVLWVAVAAIPFAISAQYATRLSFYGAILLAVIMIGLLSGARASADLTQLVRDMISFQFWIFGPMLIFLITSRPKTGDPIFSLEQVRIVLALTGAALSVRYLLQQGVGIAAALSNNLRVNLEYLSSEPLVTFAFIYAATATFRARRFSGAIGYFLLFVMASVGLVAVTYRGPLLLGFAMFISAGTLYVLTNAKSAPLRVLTIIVGTIAAVYFLQDEIGAVGTKIMGKFHNVGANSKVSEFLGVFEANTGIWQTLLGNGFGGRGFIEGAGTTTGYTHNVISYAYLKAGLFGAVLIIGALAAALFHLFRRVRRVWHYMPEILTILYIGMFQAAYKHFGFGLLLGVCIVAGYQIRHHAHATRRAAAHTFSRKQA